MGRAIIWANERDPKIGGNFLIVNTGSNEWNYQVKELAYAIQTLLPSVKVSVNKDAQPDKRSYKVSFDLFKRLAPDNQPQYQLQETINDLIEGLKKIEFKDKNFRQSRLIRLFVVNELSQKRIVDDSLRMLK